MRKAGKNIPRGYPAHNRCRALPMQWGGCRVGTPRGQVTIAKNAGQLVGPTLPSRPVAGDYRRFVVTVRWAVSITPATSSQSRPRFRWTPSQPRKPT